MKALINEFKKRLRQALCLVLVFLLVGCKSAYKLNLYTQPLGATVQVGSKIHGQTPCKIKIPKDSALIKDNHIDISYLLPDGRRMTKTYDLRSYEPPDELPYYVAGIFMVPGLLLLFLTHTSEDDQYSSFDKEDSNEDDREIGFIGLGLVGLGLLVFQVLGGDTKGIEGYDILETFDDVNEY